MHLLVSQKTAQRGLRPRLARFDNQCCGCASAGIDPGKVHLYPAITYDKKYPALAMTRGFESDSRATRRCRTLRSEHCCVACCWSYHASDTSHDTPRRQIAPPLHLRRWTQKGCSSRASATSRTAEVPHPARQRPPSPRTKVPPECAPCPATPS
jgi:hypothetical protein